MMASQVTSLTVYSGADQRKHQSSALLAFVWGIHRGPVNSPHKWPVTREMCPFDDVIIHSRRPAWCPVLTLVYRRRSSVGVFGYIHHWWHCISTDEPRFELHHTDGRARVRRRQGERHIGEWMQGIDDDIGPSAMGWISLWWQTWAGCVGWHHGPECVQTCAEKSPTLGKSYLSEQLCSDPR